MKSKYSVSTRLMFFMLIGLGFQDLSAITVRQWEVFSLSIVSDKKYENPYAGIPVSGSGDLVYVTFEGSSGEAAGKQIKITGFWNGGNEWRVNFAPPYTGVWKYRSFSADRGLNGKRGSLEVTGWSDAEKKENNTRRGFVRVCEKGENAGHYFEYSDGRPFLWIGDTWWNWTKRSINPETFRNLVDDRAEKGFNVGQLFVAANGWGRESSLLDETFTIPDTEHLKRVEEMIQYANSRGITVWIHGWWTRQDMNSKIGEEKIKRYWRYLVHRFSAYNVIWVVSGEYNMYNYGGFSIDFWKQLGAMIKEEDPYERIVSLHPTPPFWDGGAEGPQWSTGSVMHAESWLDYNQSQVGHGRYANEMIPLVITEDYKRLPSKPVVVTEPWYEFIEGNPTGLDIRFGAWSAILSGAAGHTYGGGHVWLAHLPESPGGGGSWPLEKGFERNTLDYEGAVSMKHLADFFSDIEWWNMKPLPGLVAEYPQPFCLAKPGQEYILYLRYGGTVKLTMDKSSSSSVFNFYWFNPGNGTRTEAKTVNGAGILEFHCPESYPGTSDYKDWVLHIRKE
jgi:Protein of unknown function (DUF4038)/Domain of unknown function (DUF5060)/Putative collagen-binding domain of a collagenase